MSEKLVGVVTHWFGKAEVAGIDLTDRLNVGDTIHIQGHTSDFTQAIKSMQIDRVDVESAGPGDQIGVKVGARARHHDRVYRVEPD
jgi:translation elongation factor EF-1alpha